MGALLILATVNLSARYAKPTIVITELLLKLLTDVKFIGLTVHLSAKLHTQITVEIELRFLYLLMQHVLLTIQIVRLNVLLGYAMTVINGTMIFVFPAGLFAKSDTFIIVIILVWLPIIIIKIKPFWVLLFMLPMAESMGKLFQSIIYLV